jgi:transcriptional regulator with XRE-family HTH domain
MLNKSNAIGFMPSRHGSEPSMRNLKKKPHWQAEEPIADEFDVGKRLKAVREGAGLSQRQLAKRSDVSNATISLIEQNRSSPSVGLLKRVLDGLPLSLAAFFGGEEAPNQRFFFEAHELIEIGSGGISYRQVGRDLSSRSLQVLHEMYAPGADTGEALLSHQSEESGIVIRGQIEVTVNGQSRVLGPGDAYYFDSRLPHRFRNPGDVECEIVSACTPASF